MTVQMLAEEPALIAVKGHVEIVVPKDALMVVQAVVKVHALIVVCIVVQAIVLILVGGIVLVQAATNLNL